MPKYKIDKNLQKDTKQYMSIVIKKLTSGETELDESWNAALQMLAQNYDTFIKCHSELNNSGLLITKANGELVAHPLIKVAENAEIQCIKLLNEFGLTLKASSKIGTIEQIDETSDLTNFLINKNKSEKR